MRAIRKGNSDSKTKILLCHGFGANCADLADLAGFFDPEGLCDWHFPQAPFPLPYPGSYAWFPKTAERQEEALFGSYFHELEELEDPALDEALAYLKGYVESAGEKDGEWIFGGFSQGCMVVSHLLSLKAVSCKALILFSGAAFSKKRLSDGLAAGPRLPVFMSHGIQDPVLPYPLGLSFAQVLRESGCEVDFHDFPGGHEIPSPIAEEALLFFRKLVSANRPG